MEALGKIAAGLIAFAGLLFFALLIGPLAGYVGGAVFEWLFTDTWATMHTWLNMPANLTGGMLGAFLGCFGSLVGKAATKKQD